MVSEGVRKAVLYIGAVILILGVLMIAFVGGGMFLIMDLPMLVVGGGMVWWAIAAGRKAQST